MIVRTVFLDRDGTLNVKARDGEYITDPDDLVLLPGAAGAVRRLNEAGITTVLVTNQRCIGLGKLSPEDYERVATRLRALLAAEGAFLDAEYVCPHENGHCDCRKPLPGLLLRAAAQDDAVDLATAAIVGDAESDIAAGRAAGLTTVRLAPGEATSGADHVASDLAQAVDWLLLQAHQALR